MARIPWNDARDELLRKSAAQTDPILTSEQIANRIAIEFGDECNRGAVIGRANRIGVRLLGQSLGWNQHKNASVQPAPKKKAARLHAPKPVVIQGPPGGKLIVDIDAGECRWPIGDTWPHRFCGATAEELKPYCAKHHHESRNHNPPRSRPARIGVR